MVVWENVSALHAALQNKSWLVRCMLFSASARNDADYRAAAGKCATFPGGLIALIFGAQAE